MTYLIDQVRRERNEAQAQLRDAQGNLVWAREQAESDQRKVTEAHGQVAALAKSLRCQLPINSRGNCFYCDLGVSLAKQEEGEDLRHASSQFPEDDHYCLNGERYEDERRLLADLPTASQAILAAAEREKGLRRALLALVTDLEFGGTVTKRNHAVARAALTQEDTSD